MSAAPPNSLAALIDLARLERLGVDVDSTAITDGSASLSWREFDRRVGQLATVLMDGGVRRGDRVAVHLAKSVDSFCAVHAVLRAGAVMVPLDSLAPVTAVSTVAADAEPTALVTDARDVVLGPLLDQLRPPLVVVPTRNDVPELAAEGLATATADAIAAADPFPGHDGDGSDAIGPDDPAYIIYTSGSTGRPKGIVHTHASALAYARAAAELYALTPADHHANIAPLHFDQSTFELYAAPLAGASVLVVPDPVMRFPASLAQLVEEQRVTVWYSVPYLLTQLLERGGLDERHLSSLRWVLFGGESFPPAALAALMQRLPSCRFSNVYGPAEVNQCTHYEPTSPPEASVPIGPPWAAASVLVVEAGGDPGSAPLVAGDASGQLLVASSTMMRGYWRRDDLTARAIVRRDDRPGATWYVTGDLVRRRLDGDLEFLGRADNQVKVRGHRIELEAIDAALLDQPGVVAATVVVDRVPTAGGGRDGGGGAGGDRLVAAVVASEASIDERAMLTALRRVLPSYAVPSAITSVPSLPRTGTGKVDRNAAATMLGLDRE
ncbi:MAG: amino acid adenylation domain-containing protein [Actinomycetota bacterium]